MGHARALINVGEVEKQLFVYNTILSKKLSVRQTEELVKQLYKNPKASKEKVKKQPSRLKKIEDQLSSHFGTKATIDHNNTGRGKISFEYYSLEELNSLLEKMNVSIH
jgi:ParB family chromosome partitioning protein